jgi:CDP-glucose 4,6-dehydratase
MRLDRGFWNGRRVLLTGHTGFKGTWLTAWLARMGADVSGLALPPHHEPCLFEAAALRRRISHHEVDIRDFAAVQRVVRTSAPEIIFHMAAQPLVLKSLEEPALTFQTNVNGTLNLLEAARAAPHLRAVVVITSDKCYRDPASICAEDDALGGVEPYSASKACAELVAATYRSCFLDAARGVGLATARAGNVIGGGDFSRDRLLPDLMRAAHSGRPGLIRYPDAVRPWQHVLDALAGYLRLAQALLAAPENYATSWNFGPPADNEWTVREVADAAFMALGYGGWQAVAAGRGQDGRGHEAPVLRLSSAKARARLGWSPRLATGDAVAWAVQGYRALLGGQPSTWLFEQIERYGALEEPLPEPLAPRLRRHAVRGGLHAHA